MTTAQPLVISQNFLTQLYYAFSLLGAVVNTNLDGGTGTDVDGQDIPVLNSNLNVSAGGPNNGNTTGSFAAATQLNTQLQAVAGSINGQLVNWQKWCNDICSDLTNTIQNFGSINDFNTQTVEQFLNEFPLTTADMSPAGNSGNTG
jgi:hypothetical protein